MPSCGPQRFAGHSAAVVVVEPKTGKLRAIVSKPSFDPNTMTGHLTKAEYTLLMSDPRKPFIDKDDGNVPNHKLPEAKAPRNDGEPLCGKNHCTGVNWYCRFNAEAHD